MTDFEFSTYPKIYGPFKRFTDGPNRNRLNTNEWTKPEFEELQGIDWVFTEKIDGTNIRIGWDGYSVRFGGRTERAQIPKPLLEYLETTFTEELFEQEFGEQSVILYGEGYGGKIQKGGVYRPDESFLLFDVKAGKWWLRRRDVEEVASKLGIEAVSYVHLGSLRDAISIVSCGFNTGAGAGFAEGLVGTTAAGLLDRSGNRIQVKIKHVDFYKGK